jgi:hypothetical protein
MPGEFAVHGAHNGAPPRLLSFGGFLPVATISHDSTMARRRSDDLVKAPDMY